MKKSSDWTTSTPVNLLVNKKQSKQQEVSQHPQNPTMMFLPMKYLMPNLDPGPSNALGLHHPQ